MQVRFMKTESFPVHQIFEGLDEMTVQWANWYPKAAPASCEHVTLHSGRGSAESLKYGPSNREAILRYPEGPVLMT